MRTKFFAIAALVLGLASCQRDFAPEGNVGGEVDFKLEVSAPELGATRADKDSQAGHDSAYGAIDYLSEAEWAEVDLRYILEVYDKADDYTNAEPIKDRQVIIVDKYKPVKFELRLAPKRDYHFVVFADFVAQGATDVPTVGAQENIGLRHNIGATLGNITIKADAINDELADAYFGTLDYNPSHNTHNNNLADQKPLILKRPYSKVRVVATDLAELNLNVEPASVKVEYTAPHATAFNAVNGTISSFESKKVFEGNYNELFKDVKPVGLSNHFYTEGYDAKTAPSKSGVERHTHMTLFTDYILATDKQETIQFTMTVFDKKLDDDTKQPIKTTAFNTQIPVQRNYLTTIIGNVLTTATEIEVSIDDNFASELNDENVNVKERILLETLINGGVFDLTEDLTITAPTWLKGDAVIRLNGNTLTYDIPADKESDNNYAIMTRVENGSSLTFVGEGEVVSEGYIASVNEGGVLNISEGTFESEGCTVFQSNGGKINISGGEFKAAEYDGDHRYTINFVDSKKQEDLIEISGGRFYQYNPSESHSEVPAMDFCKNGYWGIEDGEWYVVVPQQHIELYADHADVYTDEGLLQWAYIVNYGPTAALAKAVENFDATKFNKNSYGLSIKANIKMQMFTVEADSAKEAYVYTTTPITITDGKPSGSNWEVVGYNKDNTIVDCVIDGNDHTINNLTINTANNYVGLVGLSENVEFRNITFNNATIYSTGTFVSVIGSLDDGSYIHNVHTKNSQIYGNLAVGAITGSAMDHYDQIVNVNAAHTGLMGGVADGLRKRRMPVSTVENCTVDSNTTVISKGGYAGGILGQAYGCVVVNCHTKADVTGNGQHTGGVVGYTRDYHYGEYVYIVNCSSTDCKVKGTTSVGGICGHLLEGHDGSAYVVGCYTNAEVSATTTSSIGAIVGYNSGTNQILGCYANSSLKAVGYPANASTPYSFVYSGGITDADKAVMNDGIANYNTFAANYQFSTYVHGNRCPYTPADCIYNVSIPQAKLW